MDLVDADDSIVGSRSSANMLWEFLVQLPGARPRGRGEAPRSKQLRLIAVVDSVVLRALGHPGTGYWRDLRHRLRADDRQLHTFLAGVLRDVRLDERVGVIQAFDVIVWLTAKNHISRRGPLFG